MNIAELKKLRPGQVVLVGSPNASGYRIEARRAAAVVVSAEPSKSTVRPASYSYYNTETKTVTTIVVRFLEAGRDIITYSVDTDGATNGKPRVPYHRRSRNLVRIDRIARVEGRHVLALLHETHAEWVEASAKAKKQRAEQEALEALRTRATKLIEVELDEPDRTVGDVLAQHGLTEEDYTIKVSIHLTDDTARRIGPDAPMAIGRIRGVRIEVQADGQTLTCSTCGALPNPFGEESTENVDTARFWVNHHARNHHG